MFLVLVCAMWNLLWLKRCSQAGDSPSSHPLSLGELTHKQIHSSWSSLSLAPLEPQELQDVLQGLFPAAAGIDVLSQSQKCGIHYLQNLKTN